MSTQTKAARRERLLTRRRPSVTYHLAVVDPADAVAELTAAREALTVAEYRDDDGAEQAVTEARARLDAAQQAVDACYEPIVMTAMEPKAFEALAAEHPPRDGVDERWDGTTFPREVFLRSVDTADLTAEEWSTFVESAVAKGEREALFLTALGINARLPGGDIPKG